MENRGKIANELAKSFYREPSLVPPMPWVNRKQPKTPNAVAAGSKGNVNVVWSAVPGCQKYAVQVRVGRNWQLSTVTAGTKIILRGSPDAIAISAVNRYGNTSLPRVLAKR